MRTNQGDIRSAPTPGTPRGVFFFETSGGEKNFFGEITGVVCRVFTHERCALWEKNVKSDEKRIVERIEFEVLSGFRDGGAGWG